jgi:hypothetical protein
VQAPQRLHESVGLTLRNIAEKKEGKTRYARRPGQWFSFLVETVALAQYWHKSRIFEKSSLIIVKIYMTHCNLYNRQKQRILSVIRLYAGRYPLKKFASSTSYGSFAIHAFSKKTQ